MLVVGILLSLSSCFIEDDEMMGEDDEMRGACDSTAGELRARRRTGTSGLLTVGSNSDHIANGECITKFIQI